MNRVKRPIIKTGNQDNRSLLFLIQPFHMKVVIHKSIPTEKLRHDPQKVKLPPYHPDTPEMRHDWAQYYDKIEDMDAWVGSILKELEESGEAENTIVFYYGDHGGVLGPQQTVCLRIGNPCAIYGAHPEEI